MPELPEVENYARDLKPMLVGRRIVDVQIFWPRTINRPAPEAFIQALLGRQIVNTDRRGKFLLFALDDHSTLILHLRMTGGLCLKDPLEEPHKHTHVVLGLDNGQQLHYRDQRKFGRFYLVEDPTTVVGKLGPEPLSEAFTPADLLHAVQGRRSPIKALLLDQTLVAGIGNIYADEALFLAGIDPRRPGNTLTLVDCTRLHTSIRQALADAIRDGGSSLGKSALSNYARPTGIRGRYQDRHRVFRRTGQPCPVCGTPIMQVRIAQRSTHFCPHCQDNSVMVIQAV